MPVSRVTQEAVGRWREFAKSIIILGAGDEWYNGSKTDATLENLPEFPDFEAFLVKELSAAYQRGVKEERERWNKKFIPKKAKCWHGCTTFVEGKVRCLICGKNLSPSERQR